MVDRSTGIPVTLIPGITRTGVTARGVRTNSILVTGVRAQRTLVYIGTGDPVPRVPGVAGTGETAVGVRTSGIDVAIVGTLFTLVDVHTVRNRALITGIAFTGGSAAGIVTGAVQAAGVRGRGASRLTGAVIVVVLVPNLALAAIITGVVVITGTHHLAAGVITRAGLVTTVDPANGVQHALAGLVVIPGRTQGTRRPVIPGVANTLGRAGGILTMGIGHTEKIGRGTGGQTRPVFIVVLVPRGTLAAIRPGIPGKTSADHRTAGIVTGAETVTTVGQADGIQHTGTGLIVIPGRTLVTGIAPPTGVAHAHGRTAGILAMTVGRTAQTGRGAIRGTCPVDIVVLVPGGTRITVIPGIPGITGADNHPGGIVTGAVIITTVVRTSLVLHTLVTLIQVIVGVALITNLPRIPGITGADDISTGVITGAVITATVLLALLLAVAAGGQKHHHKKHTPDGK